MNNHTCEIVDFISGGNINKTLYFYIINIERVACVKIMHVPRETPSCNHKRLSDTLLYSSSTYIYMVSSTLRYIREYIYIFFLSPDWPQVLYNCG